MDDKVFADPDRYERLECIGRGSYGDVYKGVDTQTGQQVAIKVIDLEDIEDDIEDIHKEIATLAGCSCKQITGYYASVLKPGSTELFIVMELMSCSVADLLQHGPLDEASIAYILRETLHALAYLHGENRIHRDIKAANILLSSAGEVKMSDFGVSGQLTGTLGFRRRTFVGTPYWMAPEVIESSEEGYTQTADVWSLGITAIEMASGQPPHADLHPMRALFIIPKNPPPALEGNFSDQFKEFVATCLQKVQTARPSARELLQHPFIATAAPVPDLAGMVGVYANRRHPVQPGRGGSADDYGATLPTWDFGGTKKLTGKMTLAGLQHKMGDALKPAVVERFVQGGPSGDMQRTLTSAEASSARSHLHLQSDEPGSTDTRRIRQVPSSSGRPPLPADATAGYGGTVKSAAPPRGAAAGGTLRSADVRGSYYGTVDSNYGTVRVHEPNTSGGGQASIPLLSPARQTGSDGGAPPEKGGLNSRLSSLKQLQVDVTPAGSSSVQAEGPIVTRPASHDASAAESAAVLDRVVAPAVKALQATQPHAATLAAQLQQCLTSLEKACPGSSSKLVSEMLLQLSIADQPALLPVKQAAATVFGGDAARSSKPKSASLGPLGDFLMSNWREEVARDAVQATRWSS